MQKAKIKMALTIIMDPSELPRSEYCLRNAKREDKIKSLNSSSSEESRTKSKQTKSESKRSWKKKLEIFLLILLIVAVCSLFVTPTILYALPPLSLAKVQEVSSVSQSGLSGCKSWKNYTGEVCINELMKKQSCYASQVEVIRIPFETNEAASELTATRLLQGLPLLSPSPECEAAIKPFLCLYLFGSCDANNQHRQATEAACLKLRDNVCAQEWALTEKFIGKGILPDCSSLDKQEDECHGSNSSVLSSPDTNVKSTNASINITCADGFYLSDSAVCRPLCSLWVEPMEIDINYIAVIITLTIGLLAAVVLIVLALTVQRRNTLMFPAYYLVYLCVTSIVLGLLILTGIASEGKLFCSSYDLLETFVNESAFCTFSGIVFTYGLSQLGLFVLFHAIGLCWGVAFPFHLRRIKAEEKLKYIHIATVLIALFLPLVPALLHLDRGYGVANTPTTVCLGRSVDVSFYSFILPLSIISAVATAIFIVMLWMFVKKSTLKKFSVNVNSREAGLMRRAEIKILFIMCYYVILGALVLTLFTYLEAVGVIALEGVEQYFTCQSTGLDSGRDCGSTPREQLGIFRSLSVVSTVFSDLFPVVVLAFTVKCDCIKSQK